MFVQNITQMIIQGTKRFERCDPLLDVDAFPFETGNQGGSVTDFSSDFQQQIAFETRQTFLRTEPQLDAGLAKRLNNSIDALVRIISVAWLVC